VFTCVTCHRLPCRKLICKIEEIHITLRKHLAKEEAQLLPLLLQHFSHAEQAELVAQFMYCIPLDTVERVLSWLKPMVPLEELQELMQHLRDVIPDRLLLQLLVTWLNPAPAGSSSSSSSMDAAAAAGAGAGAAAHGQQQQQPLVICPFAAPSKQQVVLAAGSSSSGAQVAAARASQAQQWPPLRVSVFAVCSEGSWCGSGWLAPPPAAAVSAQHPQRLLPPAQAVRTG
jgi:hypothetical protein